MSHIEVKALELMGVQIKAKTEDKKDVKVIVDDQGKLQFYLPKLLQLDQESGLSPKK